MSILALQVPMHIDALFIEHDLSVMEPMADFSRQPYVDRETGREINPDIANISEQIVSLPFEGSGLQLKPGIHLHWALPDALTKGTEKEKSIQFPPVPNLWLVTRTHVSQPDQWEKAMGRNYREANGPFRTRASVKKVPRLGPKAFELSAGFLRITNGDDPLDVSCPS